MSRLPVVMCMAMPVVIGSAHSLGRAVPGEISAPTRSFAARMAISLICS